MDPESLPADVDRVVLVGSCDPDDAASTFHEMRQVVIGVGQVGAEPVEFRPPELVDGERAVLLAELYRRGTTWKLRAIGQGYADGLAGLATDFGVRVEEPAEPEEPEEPVEPEESSRAERPEPVPAVPVPADPSLRGTDAPGTLVKSGHVPRGDPLLPPGSPGAGDTGRAADPAKKGSAKKEKEKRGKEQQADVVYYRRRGSLNNRPFIKLDGDSRVPGRESIRIVRPAEQGYILLCAYSALSNGFGSFRSFGAKVVVTDGRGSTVTVPLFENTRTRYWVAIALVDFTAPDGAVIHHVEAYSARMTERRPVLHTDGTIEMNGGPVEFKRR